MKALIAALATTALGVALLFVYMKRFEQEVKGGPTVQVLVAREDIPLGEQLSQDMVALREMPKAYVQERNIQSGDAQRVLGARVRTAIGAGESILWTDLATSSEQNRHLSSLVREGMRAVNVQASRTSAFGGLLRPGDRVDVLLTMAESPSGPVTFPLLQNVLVLAVGTDTGGVHVDDDGRDEEIANITLVVSVEQAQLITFGASRGSMSLSLRNPDDIRVTEELPETKMGDLIEAERRAVVQRRTVVRKSKPSVPSPLQ